MFTKLAIERVDTLFPAVYQQNPGKPPKTYGVSKPTDKWINYQA